MPKGYSGTPLAKKLGYKDGMAVWQHGLPASIRTELDGVADITEDTIRDVALPIGLVDVKVCAVDTTWSGLKLVIRKELRV